MIVSLNWMTGTGLGAINVEMHSVGITTMLKIANDQSLDITREYASIFLFSFS